MKQIRSQPLRCPLCERGRIIDAGPMARVSQFTLYGPQYVQHAQLIVCFINDGKKGDERVHPGQKQPWQAALQ